MRTLNLGIVAHVDAGKTTLTERLLYAAGVIAQPGSVDAGTTQTDSLALEQQRGITIKSAVVSFAIDDVAVNLIDTPGHPDFIAEVERVLNVLDGAVLVLSAVEGVQPQTRILMRALQRSRVPTLMFVNKTDRRGADVERVLEEIREKLTPSIVAMHDPDLAALAEHDDRLLAAYVEGIDVPRATLRSAVAEQAERAVVYPVFAGSALKGIGMEPLMSGIAELLPATAPDGEGAAAGSIFKIERGPAGEKIAYVRMFSGALRTRDRLRFGPEREELQAGVFGWSVTDCVVTMTESGYSLADGPPSRRGPTSTAADFRKLTPMVVKQALERAGTVVCEPTVRVALEVPTSTVGAVLPALARLGATVDTPVPQETLARITAVLPASRADELQRQLPGLTGGEGVMDTTFEGYQEVNGEPPVR